MDTKHFTLNSPDEVRAYALQGYCLCEKCDSIRRAELADALIDGADHAEDKA